MEWITRTRPADRDLWWVRLILNVGRPVVAIFVLVMCAPGEHYLARQAGWNNELAWGMPGTLTAYAGIAAVVATKRAPGTPGKRTAVWGAILAILTAMAAQPIAHLYGRPGMTAQQVSLIIVVSCIPALVFGHLLHMAAVRTPDTVPDVPMDVREQDMRPPVLASVPDQDSWSPDAARWLPEAAEEGWSEERTQDRTLGREEDTPAGQDVTVSLGDNPSRVRRTQDGTVGAFARGLIELDPDIPDEIVRRDIRDRFGPDIKPDTIRKAISRARKERTS